MRISELSAVTGVSVASIKYYTRAGLIPPGERVGYNQTRYGEQHITRLKLIGALVNRGGLTIATTRDVLAAVDDDGLELGDVFAVAQQASSLTPEAEPASPAVERVLAFAHKHGWDIVDCNPGVAMVASAIEAFDAVTPADHKEPLSAYAEAADHIAQADLSSLPTNQDRARSAETVVVGTVLGDTIIAGLRRMAQEHHSKMRLADQTPATPPDNDGT